MGVVLSRLEDTDLVRHRGEYWAIGDADDIDTTLSFMASARAATDRLGADDPEDWGPGVDDLCDALVADEWEGHVPERGE